MRMNMRSTIMDPLGSKSYAGPRPHYCLGTDRETVYINRLLRVCLCATAWSTRLATRMAQKEAIRKSSLSGCSGIQNQVRARSRVRNGFSHGRVGYSHVDELIRRREVIQHTILTSAQIRSVSRWGRRNSTCAVAGVSETQYLASRPSGICGVGQHLKSGWLVYRDGLRISRRRLAVHGIKNLYPKIAYTLARVGSGIGGRCSISVESNRHIARICYDAPDKCSTGRTDGRRATPICCAGGRSWAQG